MWNNFDDNDVRRQDAENLNAHLRLAASSLRFARLPLVLPLASASIARPATPLEVNAFAKRQPWETIQQTFAYIAGEDTKQQHLSNIILHLRNNGSFREGKKLLVFCNRGDDVRRVVDDLLAENLGVNIRGIARDYAQHDRGDVLQLFTSPNGDLPVVVCTQILGSGHYFRDVAFVMNYDMPTRIEEYLHRIGIAGRAGREGYSMTFITEEDLVMASDLVAYLTESRQVVPSFLTEASTREALESSSECDNDSDSTGEVPYDAELLDTEDAGRPWVTWLMRGA